MRYLCAAPFWRANFCFSAATTGPMRLPFEPFIMMTSPAAIDSMSFGSMSADFSAHAPRRPGGSAS
jgi:hypothetical protein